MHQDICYTFTYDELWSRQEYGRWLGGSGLIGSGLV